MANSKSNEYFDKNAYKDIADEIKLTCNQKQILLDKMRAVSKDRDMSNNKITVKSTHRILFKAVAAVLAVVLLCSIVFFGTALNGKDKYDFSIVAMAAELDTSTNDEAELVELTTDNAIDVDHTIMLSPVFKSDGYIHKNKNGYEELLIEIMPKAIYPEGDNIKSVTYSSDNMYFSIPVGNVCSFGDKSDYYIDYTDVKPSDNSSFTENQLYEITFSKEAQQFCNSFTCSYDDAKKMIFSKSILDNDYTLGFVTETNRSDELTDKYVKNIINSGLENGYNPGNLFSLFFLAGFGEADAEYQYILEKALEGKSYDITVTFDDGTKRTKTVVFGTEKKEVYDMYWDKVLTKNCITAIITE